MRPSRIVSVALSAAFLTACQPHAPLRSDAQWSQASAACDDAVRECRGLRGQRSSGQTFAGEDFGISAVFPVGAWVCPAFSGLAVHGYFSREGEAPFDCLDAAPSGTTTYGVRASGNAAFLATLDEGRGAERPCLSDERFGGMFAIEGLETRTCVEHRPDGGLLVEVEAAAGRWGEDSGEDANKPYVFYTAWLLTREETWARDAVLFERFLRSLSVAVPAAE